MQIKAVVNLKISLEWWAATADGMCKVHGLGSAANTGHQQQPPHK